MIGDDFLIQDLTVLDAPKDGIRVEGSSGVVYRRIRATWTTPSSPDNGAYGIYPVKSQNVLVEDSRAENASDAGLYVGQCQHVIVRNNVVTGNVAGLEIENTQYADVYGNIAENNTGGIVVADLEPAARSYLDINCAHCHSPQGVQGMTSQLFPDHPVLPHQHHAGRRDHAAARTLVDPRTRRRAPPYLDRGDAGRRLQHVALSGAERYDTVGAPPAARAALHAQRASAGPC